MKKVIKKLGKIFYLFLYRLFRFLPVKNNLVFFESNVGRNYSDNPKYIFEALVRRNEAYRCIWSLEKVNISYYEVTPASLGSSRITVVKRKSIPYFYYLARSSVWVSNCRMPGYLKKRKKQTYIQTWHGTPLKKLALDMENVAMSGEHDIESYHKGFISNSHTWDYLISQNPFSCSTFKRCFDFHGTILKSGYPRNDILFQKNNEYDISLLKRKLSIPDGKKTILYAPTWRDDEANGNDTYRFPSSPDFDKFISSLDESTIVLVKYHYLVRDNRDWSRFRGRVLLFDEHCDISELYLVSDMLITDYSSVMFDYGILNRPMIFYCYDLEKYRETLRGFYFDFLSEAPGPIAVNADGLAEAVQKYNKSSWESAHTAFREKYNTYDNGHASEQLAELISDIVHAGKKQAT